MGNERNEGDVLHGQLFDPRDRFTVPYTQQELSKPVADGKVGDVATEVTPTDRQSSQVKVYDAAAVAAQLNSIVLGWADTTSFYVPDELLGIQVVFNSTSSSGEKIVDAGLAYSAGTSGGLDFNPSATAQASANSVPELVYNTRSHPAQNVPSMHYVFYIQQDIVTNADVIAKLIELGITPEAEPAMVWPKFQPQELLFVLRGQQFSVQQSASSSHSDRWSGSNLSYSITPNPAGMGSISEGYSIETGVSIRSVRIPPTLHAGMTLTGSTQDATATVSVRANLPEITGTGSAPSFAAVNNEPTPITVTATASVLPTVVDATLPTFVPSSGLYIKSINSQPYVYGFSQVHVELVDFENV